jgi:hypothetical protein
MCPALSAAQTLCSALKGLTIDDRLEGSLVPFPIPQYLSEIGPIVQHPINLKPAIATLPSR